MRRVERQCRSARRMQPMALAADVEAALIKMPYRAGDYPSLIAFTTGCTRCAARRHCLQRAWRKLQAKHPQTSAAAAHKG